MCRRFLCLVSYVCVNVRVYISMSNVECRYYKNIYVKLFGNIALCNHYIQLDSHNFHLKQRKKRILCAWLYFAVMSYPFCNYNWWFCVSACMWLCPDVLSELCMTTVRMHKRTFFWAHERIFLFIMDTIHSQKKRKSLQFTINSLIWKKKRLRCSTYNLKKTMKMTENKSFSFFMSLSMLCVLLCGANVCVYVTVWKKECVHMCKRVCVVRMCTILYLSLSILYEWALQIKSKHTKESKWRQQIKWKKK